MASNANTPCLSSALHGYEATTTMFAVLANAALAYFVIFRTEKKLQAYSRVLLCGCLVDFAYTLSSYIFEIVSSSNGYRLGYTKQQLLDKTENAFSILTFDQGCM